MKSSMFLFAALVLCALPSALGSEWCYECTPNLNTTNLCNNMTQYTMNMCQYDNSSCYMSTIMSSGVTAYVLGCVDHPETCNSTETTVCQNARAQAMQLSMTIDTCIISCPLANLSNNPLAMMTPTPTTIMATMTASVTTAMPTTTTTTNAAEHLCPKFLGVLFIILFTMLRQ